MRQRLRGAAASCVLVLVASCGGGAGGNEVPAPTPPTQPPVINPAAAPAWDAAVVFLPHSTSRSNMASLVGQRAAPVVIAMHGCSGLGSLPNLGPLLASLGYVVIMPDSLARPDRANRFTCSGSSIAVSNLDIYDKRVEEVEFSIAQVQGKTWFDGRHLLLLGHSEGGYAVAQKAYAGITAAAVSGYWCTVGLAVAQVAPTLTVNYDQDPFYFNKPGFVAPNCSGGMAGSRHLVLQGALHTAFENEPGRSELTSFATTQASN